MELFGTVTAWGNEGVRHHRDLHGCRPSEASGTRLGRGGKENGEGQDSPVRAQYRGGLASRLLAVEVLLSIYAAERTQRGAGQC